MYLDYLKYHGSIMGLYSHGANEWTANQWIDLFEVLHENRSVKTAGLAEIAAIVKEQCESTGPWTYRGPWQSGPAGGETSFRPGQDSPLIGAGVPTEFTRTMRAGLCRQGRGPISACIDGKQAIAAITRTTQKKESPFGQLLFLWAFAENPADLLRGLCYQTCLPGLFEQGDDVVVRGHARVAAGADIFQRVGGHGIQALTVNLFVHFKLAHP